MSPVSRISGFTLTELMIVIFVLGLSATFVLPLFSNTSPEKIEAILLKDIQQANQQAQAEKRPYMIAFNEKGWSLLALQPIAVGEPSPWPGLTWVPVSARQSRALPPGMSVVLSIPEGVRTEPKHILFLPDNSNILPVVNLLHNNQKVKRFAFQDGEYKEFL